jgi:hypothetical protein
VRSLSPASLAPTSEGAGEIAFAGKPGSYERRRPGDRFRRQAWLLRAKAPGRSLSPASLAPTSEQSTAVYLPHRVIILRGRQLQAKAPVRSLSPASLAPTSEGVREIAFAGKPGSYERRRPGDCLRRQAWLLQRTIHRGLPAPPRHHSSWAPITSEGAREIAFVGKPCACSWHKAGPMAAGITESDMYAVNQVGSPHRQAKESPTQEDFTLVFERIPHRLQGQ